MPYNPLFPKPSTFFRTAPSTHTPPIAEVTFATRISSWSSFGYFYGTDAYNQRESYGSSIMRALNNRIAAPVNELWNNPRAYFFTPYNSLYDAVNTLLSGPLNAALLATSLFSDPYLLIALICLPAVIEVIGCLTSALQALYHTSKAICTRNRAELNVAREYMLDATTRLALVVPLALLCVVSLPFETVRFFTRFFGTHPAPAVPANARRIQRDDTEAGDSRFPGRGYVLGTGDEAAPAASLTRRQTERQASAPSAGPR